MTTLPKVVAIQVSCNGFVTLSVFNLVPTLTNTKTVWGELLKDFFTSNNIATFALEQRLLSPADDRLPSALIWLNFINHDVINPDKELTI